MSEPKTYVVKAAGDTPDQLLLDIDAIEQRANRMHLFPCARALNNAKNAAGWQLAGNLDRAAEAVTHKD